MSKFLQFKQEPNWIYETSPYIDILDLDAIRLCPNEWYVQSIMNQIETNLYENIPTSSPFPFINSTDLLALNASLELVLTVNNSDGLQLTITPQNDYTNISFVNFCFSFNSTYATAVDFNIDFVSNLDNTVFHNQVVNFLGNTAVDFNIENVNIQGNTDYRIEISSNIPDGEIFNFTLFEIKINEITDLKAIDCNGNTLTVEHNILTSDNNIYLQFRILEDYYEDIIRLVANNTYYSNPFVVTEYNKCFTSIIHYRNNIEDCYCDAEEVYYNSIRLKIIEKDCEDADEFEQYREFTTGKTRSSRAKENTYNIFTLEADKLVNDCFKQAYNSSEFYINKVRHSKVDPFNRGQRLGATNCSITEFKTSIIEEEVITFDEQT